MGTRRDKSDNDKVTCAAKPQIQSYVSSCSCTTGTIRRRLFERLLRYAYLPRTRTRKIRRGCNFARRDEVQEGGGGRAKKRVSILLQDRQSRGAGASTESTSLHGPTDSFSLFRPLRNESRAPAEQASHEKARTRSEVNELGTFISPHQSFLIYVVNDGFYLSSSESG